MPYGNFSCVDCGVDTSEIHEYYRLEDAVWAKAGYTDDVMACIGCVETRLKRTLDHRDFAKVYINDRRNRTNSHRSMRLSKRMGLV